MDAGYYCNKAFMFRNKGYTQKPQIIFHNGKQKESATNEVELKKVGKKDKEVQKNVTFVELFKQNCI